MNKFGILHKLTRGLPVIGKRVTENGMGAGRERPIDRLKKLVKLN